MDDRGDARCQRCATTPPIPAPVTSAAPASRRASVWRYSARVVATRSGLRQERFDRRRERAAARASHDAQRDAVAGGHHIAVGSIAPRRAPQAPLSGDLAGNAVSFTHHREATSHHPNEYLVLVGESSKARKGSFVGSRRPTSSTPTRRFRPAPASRPAKAARSRAFHASVNGSGLDHPRRERGEACDPLGPRGIPGISSAR